MSSRYYPQKTGALADEHVFQAHKKAFDEIYALHDKLTAMQADLQSKLDAANAKAHQAQQDAANQKVFTKISGLEVKATLPQNGQVLKFNSASGQIEWT